MELLDRNPGLGEAMQEGSMLSENDPAEVRSRDLIVEALTDVLDPGERVIAYADRDLHANQIDALAYDKGQATEVPDIMGYRPGGPRNQTDAFAYDEEAGRAQPDVMGYQAGAPNTETDALAYDRPAETPQNDAFMSAVPPRAADVDFLALTEGRLIRGFLEGGDVMITETPYGNPQTRIVADTYLAVQLPEAVCGLGEGAWWCWRVPDGREPRAMAKRWSRN